MSATAATATLPMPSMRGKNRELWVGIFVLAGIFAVLYTLFTLTSPSTFRGRAELVTRLPEAAGIRKGDPVQMRGVNIGRVSGFHLVRDGVSMELEVEREFFIPSDSKVQIRSSNLLGEMVADIVPGTSTQPVRPGQILPGSVFESPFGQAEGVAGQASKTLERVEALLNDQTIANVSSSSAELDGALKQLRTLAASMQRSAREVEGAVGGKKLEALVAQMDSASASLARSAQATEAILARVQRGEGSLGRLSQDESLYRNVDTAAANLARAANELTALTNDIRNNPGKYLKISIF